MNGKLRFASALVTALCLVPIPALAEPDAAAKAEAAKRFDRGLQLFDEGDTAGALAEFKQTYATLPNPVVLYNIGLVYAAMGRPVDAVDALSGVANDTTLSQPQRERAQSTLADQEARIGRLRITTAPAGARISIDGVDVATTPLTTTLRVSAGTHVVGAVAEGYALARKEVVVAGRAEASLEFQLVRADAQRDANLMVRSRVSGAEIFVDGKSAGKTPLRASLAIPAGKHEVELRRPGYKSARQELQLTEGATGELTLDLPVDSGALSTEGVSLTLDLGAQKNAELYVDSEHLGAYRGPVRLPKGPHRVRVEAAGYLPFERDVLLEEGKTNVLSGKLEPTPEARAAHEANVSFHRTWGFVSLGAGALIGGASAAFLALNSSSKSDARDALSAANTAADSKTTAPFCDTRSGANTPAECQAYVDEKQTEYDNAKGRDLIGFVGIGVGAAALVTGVVFLLTGEDSNKYASAPSKRAPNIAFSAGPGSWGATLSGSF
ncbi:MAG: hypothetical protein K0R38_944 [Polyangiaceae bacterium]|jgi:hypothetical protein|nr:hypothetical protein [Polyangiaceae bacterium]